jgi:Cdc6-like AAA superfamily ATPase
MSIPLLICLLHEDCLTSLKVETARYENITPEHPGSFETWLPNHELYRAWLDCPDSSLLLVTGKPGSGKSTLCKYVLRRLHTIDIRHMAMNSDVTGVLVCSK